MTDCIHQKNCNRFRKNSFSHFFIRNRRFERFVTFLQYLYKSYVYKFLFISDFFLKISWKLQWKLNNDQSWHLLTRIRWGNDFFVAEPDQPRFRDEFRQRESDESASPRWLMDLLRAPHARPRLTSPRAWWPREKLRTNIYELRRRARRNGTKGRPTHSTNSDSR